MTTRSARDVVERHVLVLASAERAIEDLRALVFEYRAALEAQHEQIRILKEHLRCRSTSSSD